MAALIRMIARHPVLAFMVIGLGAYFLTVRFRDLQCRGLAVRSATARILGGAARVGLGALLVTRALAGHDDVI
jgi:hypothetical protein